YMRRKFGVKFCQELILKLLRIHEASEKVIAGRCDRGLKVTFTTLKRSVLGPRRTTLTSSMPLPGGVHLNASCDAGEFTWQPPAPVNPPSRDYSPCGTRSLRSCALVMRSVFSSN